MSATATETLTPMLKQYLAIKERETDADTILFFRLGDFYEMFFDDAVIASKVLGITLTSRNKNAESPIPLCGVPYHSADGYIAKLVASGKKVAICEQVEDPKASKGIVERAVIRTVTPGVVLDADSLNAKENNYLMAIFPTGNDTTRLAISVCDASTGELSAGLLDDLETLQAELAKIEPREVLLPLSKLNTGAMDAVQRCLKGIPVTWLEEKELSPEEAIAKLKGMVLVRQQAREALPAARAIWTYLSRAHKGDISHLQTISLYHPWQGLVIDESTKRNLELSRTLYDGDRFGSLIWLLDRTHTSMGARRMKNWMLRPLTNISYIRARQKAISQLLNDVPKLTQLTEHLDRVNDIERIAARISTGLANARDMIGLRDTLQVLPTIANTLTGMEGLLNQLAGQIQPLDALADEILNTLVDEPPLGLKDGQLIRPGINGDLDELRELASSGKDFIAKLEQEERARTGISSLKVRYNKVFGYYIEITNTHKDKVPSDYIRKQTLANAERYITPGLKTYEERVLTAEDRSKALEYEIFCNLRERCKAKIGSMLTSSEALATIDALVSLADVARLYRYVCPDVSNEGDITIEEGRHPIIEQLNPTERFVPNDVHLNTTDQRMMMITGPNMAGKSTIMRQTALIILMAQMGSFVPAKSATIAVVDRICTRVGASDNLVRGESTFMVEMKETAAILRHATEKSYVLIDEVGRGTSTYDGVSLAWAIAEYLHDVTKAKVMFATHYHEMTDMALTKKGIQNFTIAVKEWNEDLIFLRKLVKGGVSRSFGIQVARLAGVPKEIIERAREILSNLEREEFDAGGAPRLAHHTEEKPADRPSATQFHLFSGPDYGPIIDQLKALDITVTTPIEALNLLYKLKNELS